MDYTRNPFGVFQQLQSQATGAGGAGGGGLTPPGGGGGGGGGAGTMNYQPGQPTGYNPATYIPPPTQYGFGQQAPALAGGARLDPGAQFGAGGFGRPGGGLQQRNLGLLQGLGGSPFGSLLQLLLGMRRPSPLPGGGAPLTQQNYQPGRQMGTAGAGMPYGDLWPFTAGAQQPLAGGGAMIPLNYQPPGATGGGAAGGGAEMPAQQMMQLYMQNLLRQLGGGGLGGGISAPMPPAGIAGLGGMIPSLPQQSPKEISLINQGLMRPQMLW